MADVRAFRRLALRTRAVRAALRLLLFCAVCGLVFSGRHGDNVRRTATLPLRTSAIIVLDVSASDWESGGVGRVLESIVDKGGRYGLVLESNQAYLAMPPGTPAVDFRPLLRYFVLPARPQHGVAPTLPPDPWEPEFTAGDDFSAALMLAADIELARPGRKPGVIFVSDLGDGPDDWTRLAYAIAVYQANHIPLKVAATAPDPTNFAFFQHLLGRNGVITINSNAPPQSPDRIGGFPERLVALVVVLAVLLAVAARRAVRLRWGGPVSLASSLELESR